MIEINTKAKQDDPWETPPLDWAGFVAARDAGKLIWLFRFDPEVGMFRNYDCIPASKGRPVETFAMDRWLNKPAQYQIRAHADHRVVVVQPYYDPNGSAIAANLVLPNFLTAPTREKLDARIASVKAIAPAIIFEGSPSSFVVKTFNGKKVMYAAP